MNARLTYGNLPTLQYFRLRYESSFQESHPDLTPAQARAMPYTIRHGALNTERDRSGGVRPEGRDYSLMELWSELNRLVQIHRGERLGFLDSQREEAGTWASDILGTLGMEWI